MIFIHVDCDDLWVYRQDYGCQQRDGASVFEEALPRLVDLFEKADVKATFFAIGRDITEGRSSQFLVDVVARGHAVANHSFSHSSSFGSMSAAERVDDVERAHHEIITAIGTTPIGFRGPGYVVDAPLLRTLTAFGYRYDSTEYPGWAPRAMTAAMQRRGAKKRLGSKQVREVRSMSRWYGDQDLPSHDMVELPILAPTLLRLPVHTTALFALGAPYQVIAQRMFRWGWAKRGVLLLHAIDGLASGSAPDLTSLPTLRMPLEQRLQLIQRLLEDIVARTGPVRTVESYAS